MSKYVELPFRCIDADDQVLALMAERGETADDVLWCTDGCVARCSDFRHGIMRTKRHVYTVVKDDWLGDEAYTCRVFVSAVEAP
jgi:hypothetical protein